jgi:hypothetical protein
VRVRGWRGDAVAVRNHALGIEHVVLILPRTRRGTASLGAQKRPRHQSSPRADSSTSARMARGGSEQGAGGGAQTRTYGRTPNGAASDRLSGRWAIHPVKRVLPAGYIVLLKDHEGLARGRQRHDGGPLWPWGLSRTAGQCHGRCEGAGGDDSQGLSAPDHGASTAGAYEEVGSSAPGRPKSRIRRSRHECEAMSSRSMTPHSLNAIRKGLRLPIGCTSP